MSKLTKEEIEGTVSKFDSIAQSITLELESSLKGMEQLIDAVLINRIVRATLRGMNLEEGLARSLAQLVTVKYIDGRRK